MYVFLFKIVRAFALPCKKKKAVLTIEAASVLPLFLISSITLMTLLSAYYINGRIEAAVNEEARYIAMKYFREGYSTAAVQADIESRLGDNFVNSHLIKNGKSGFDYSKTDLSDREIIYISVSYVIKPPFSIFYMYEIPCEKSVTMHSWTGYINGLNGFYDGADYVYMTKNGTVYHRNRECSHIRLTIKTVSSSEIIGLRNKSGSKYKKCEYCHPKGTEEKLYITTDGDRFHKTLMCGGLKRSIVRVRLSDIGDIPPCLRCGY